MSRASSSSARSPRSAARRSRASTSRPPSGSSTSPASSTRSASRAKDRRLAREADCGDPRDPAARHAGEEAATRRRRATRRTRTASSASCRRSCSRSRRGALRRRLRDRELALDHDRPAHPRVRNAADARRLAERQVLRSVILEALVMGVVASVVGLFLGLALAQGPVQALRRRRLHAAEQRPDLRDADDRRRARSSASSSRSLASLRPALRATRVPPIAAVREGATLPPGRFAPLPRARRGAHRAAARLRCARSTGSSRSGLGTTQVLLWMGVGALLIFIGVALFSSCLVVPLVARPRLAGNTDRRRSGVARARRTRERNPQRTASTAAALMIGLALVTLVATLAAGIIGTFNSAVDDLAPGESTRSPRRTTSRRSRSRGERRGEDAGRRVRSRASAPVTRASSATRSRLTAVEPNDRQGDQSSKWKEGSQAVLVARSGADGAFVDDGFAKNHGLTSGRSSCC